MTLSTIARPTSRPRHLLSLLLIFFLITGCEPVVRTTMGIANRAYETKDAERSRLIYDSSVARYQAMAAQGDPKGLYYMAIVHALKHIHEPGSDALTVKQLYEEAVKKGSNDAKVALGKMLVRGDTMPYAYSNPAFPVHLRDPQRGLSLLKEAAEQSCSYTEPLISIGQCREREASIPSKIYVIYRDGWGVPKDPVQAQYWKERDEKCEPIIEKTNRANACYE